MKLNSENTLKHTIQIQVTHYTLCNNIKTFTVITVNWPYQIFYRLYYQNLLKYFDKKKNPRVKTIPSNPACRNGTIVVPLKQSSQVDVGQSEDGKT